MNVKCTTGDPADNFVSDYYTMDYGVPQGSCLGPMLFIIYCNDLHLNLEDCKGILFADDTTIYKTHDNIRYLKWCVQEELSRLMDWFMANSLTLNLNKSVCMLFTNNKIISFDVIVGNTVLSRVSSTKFLGVYIDDKLNWNLHVSKLILKLKRNTNLLKLGKNFLDLHAKRIVYFAHWQSHLVYSLSVWGNGLSDTTLKRLQKSQDRCISLLGRNVSYEQAKILTVKKLVKLENVKFGHKLINHNLPPKIIECCMTNQLGSDLRKNHPYNTRNKNLPNVPKARCSKYLNSIFCQGPIEYGKLTSELKGIDKYHVFCKKYKFTLLSQT